MAKKQRSETPFILDVPASDYKPDGKMPPLTKAQKKLNEKFAASKKRAEKEAKR